MTALPERAVEAPGAGPTLYDVTLDELRSVGRDRTPEGVLALGLSRQIDEGGHSGASYAALSGAWTKARAAAMEGAQPEADVIDDIFSGRAG